MICKQGLEIALVDGRHQHNLWTRFRNKICGCHHGEDLCFKSADKSCGQRSWKGFMDGIQRQDVWIAFKRTSSTRLAVKTCHPHLQPRFVDMIYGKEVRTRFAAKFRGRDSRTKMVDTTSSQESYTRLTDMSGRDWHSGFVDDIREQDMRNRFVNAGLDGIHGQDLWAEFAENMWKGLVDGI